MADNLRLIVSDRTVISANSFYTFTSAPQSSCILGGSEYGIGIKNQHFPDGGQTSEIKGQLPLTASWISTYVSHLSVYQSYCTTTFTFAIP